MGSLRLWHVAVPILSQVRILERSRPVGQSVVPVILLQPSQFPFPTQGRSQTKGCLRKGLRAYKEKGPATAASATLPARPHPPNGPTACRPFLPFLLVLLNVFDPGRAEADHVGVGVSHFHIQRRLVPLEAKSRTPTLRGQALPTPEPSSQPSEWRG